MNGWTWEGSVGDQSGYGVCGSVRIKFEKFTDFHALMTGVDYAVNKKTEQFAQQLRNLADEMEGIK